MHHRKVYVIRNKQNNKGYVGSTSKSIERRLSEHHDAAYPGRTRDDGTLFPLHAAIQKYGIENFDIEILEDGLDLQTAQDAETEYIENLETHATVHRRGYNATWGGEEPDFNLPPKHGGNRCPKCHKGTLKHRTGPYGPFRGCSNYPKCKFTD